MSKKKLLPSLIGFSALALAFKLSTRALTRAKPAPKDASTGMSYQALDAFVEKQIDRLNIPGAALAVVAGDTVVHLRGFGRARPGGEAPAPHTPFFIGSLTKSFTALAVMQLVEAGKIELDAPVQRYLPWFCVADPQASAKMTVRHLLNQTSGLSVASGWIPLADLDDRPGAGERQARALSTLALTRPVGSAYEYSNMNYNLLGLIIEAAGGEAYPDYIQSHIFDPLEMCHSYTTRAEALHNGLAVGHRYWFWLPVPTPAADLPIPRGSLASGQLISSAEDMAHYLIAHLNEGHYNGAQILSPAGIAELHRPAVPAYSMGSHTGQYAMGWFNEEFDQTRTVWHSGLVPDFSTYMALIPDQKKGVILLINADHFMMQPILTEVGSGLASLLAGQPPAPLKFAFIPWLMRALLLIPLLQLIAAAATLRRLSLWRQHPQLRPSLPRLLGLHLLLPLIPNLTLVAGSIYLLFTKMRGFIQLFAPDVSLLALITGAFAAVWTLLRTGLILRLLRKPS